jgi:hypothetical protein
MKRASFHLGSAPGKQISRRAAARLLVSTVGGGLRNRPGLDRLTQPVAPGILPAREASSDYRESSGSARRPFSSMRRASCTTFST